MRYPINLYSGLARKSSRVFFFHLQFILSELSGKSRFDPQIQFGEEKKAWKHRQLRSAKIESSGLSRAPFCQLKLNNNMQLKSSVTHRLTRLCCGGSNFNSGSVFRPVPPDFGFSFARQDLVSVAERRRAGPEGHHGINIIGQPVREGEREATFD